MDPARFQLRIGDEQIDQLKRRLELTRWPRQIPTDPWSAGTDLDTMRRLVGRWRDEFDWRTHESQINELPHYLTKVDGADVHFLHLRGEGKSPFPILITHGWPSSFLEMVKLAERLAQPSRFGGSSAVSFDVVVPSLPGYAFSAQRSELGRWTHQLWDKLMRDVLGYQRYGAHGGDLGAGITSRLGAAFPDAVVGIHVLAVVAPRDEDRGAFTAEERAHVEALARWEAEEGGYAHQQSTGPVTLGYALGDSPAGLLAWMVEKYRAWSDCDGDLATRFTDDEILTQVSLYWLTDTILPSFRPYWEYRHCSPGHPGRIEVPTAVALFPKDLAQPPRSWIERTYNLVRFNEMPRGGHFAAHEEPGLLAADIRAFFQDVS